MSSIIIKLGPNGLRDGCFGTRIETPTVHICCGVPGVCRMALDTIWMSHRS